MPHARRSQVTVSKTGFTDKPRLSCRLSIAWFFCKEAADQSKPAKLISKLLDKRHATSITKSRKFKTEDELLEYWARYRRSDRCADGSD